MALFYIVTHNRAGSLENRFSAQCSLPGFIGHGPTPSAALRNLEDAIVDQLDDIRAILAAGAAEKVEEYFRDSRHGLVTPMSVSIVSPTALAQEQLRRETEEARASDLAPPTMLTCNECEARYERGAEHACPIAELDEGISVRRKSPLGASTIVFGLSLNDRPEVPERDVEIPRSSLDGMPEAQRCSLLAARLIIESRALA